MHAKVGKYYFLYYNGIRVACKVIYIDPLCCDLFPVLVKVITPTKEIGHDGNLECIYKEEPSRIDKIKPLLDGSETYWWASHSSLHNEMSDKEIIIECL